MVAILDQRSVPFTKLLGQHRLGHLARGALDLLFWDRFHSDLNCKIYRTTRFRPSKVAFHTNSFESILDLLS